MKSHPESSLPADVVERTVSPFRREGNCVRLRVAECLLNGVVVGARLYDDEDRLVREDPLDQSGRRHGLQLDWYDNGQLQSAEPYCRNLIHGTARQWDENGRLMGTYTLVQGTGFDIWRDTREDNTIYVSEVHTWREGSWDGYQWWFNEDQSLWCERHWRRGELHGIEREWNERGRLRRGYPKYWISGKQVMKRAYLRAVDAGPDHTLPPFSPDDQQPVRQFPPDVERVLKGVI